MYEKLIQSLRHCVECDHQGCATDCQFGKEHPLNFICMDYLLHDAADAIEELSKRIDRAVSLYNRNVEKTAMYEALVGLSPEPPKEMEP